MGRLAFPLVICSLVIAGETPDSSKGVVLELSLIHIYRKRKVNIVPRDNSTCFLDNQRSSVLLTLTAYQLCLISHVKVRYCFFVALLINIYDLLILLIEQFGTVLIMK